MIPEAMLFIISEKVREIATKRNEMIAIVKVGEMKRSRENMKPNQIILTIRANEYLNIRDLTTMVDNPTKIVLSK